MATPVLCVRTDCAGTPFDGGERPFADPAAGKLDEVASLLDKLRVDLKDSSLSQQRESLDE